MNKVDKYMASISSHLRNEENKASTSERNGKKGQTISKSEANKKDKDPTDMESMQQMIKQLTNEIIYINKNKGEEKKPFKPLFKKKINTDTPPPIPPTLGINLGDLLMGIKIPRNKWRHYLFHKSQ